MPVIVIAEALGIPALTSLRRRGEPILETALPLVFVLPMTTSTYLA